MNGSTGVSTSRCRERRRLDALGEEEAGVACSVVGVAAYGIGDLDLEVERELNSECAEGAVEVGGPIPT